MPRTIKADGRTITVPDDATPDEVNKIVGPPPKAPDTRNAVQRGFDNLTTVTPEQDATTPGFLKPIAHFGAGVIQGIGSPLIHPEQTAEGIGHLFAHPQDTAAQAGDMFENDPAKTIGATLGGAGFGAAAGELLPAGVRAASEPMQRGGGGLVEHAAGALKSDFAHGAQPGEAYLEGGGTPALTMRGLANKAEAVKSNAGQQLGTAYDNATASGVKIPSADVSDAVLTPTNRLRAIQNAPGGTGETPLLDAYESHAEPYLSSQPEFTPREAFGLKRNIADNTRWNDPTMFDMNSVRQQGVGGIGKLLTDAVPETAPLNRIYQGAGNLAERAGTRADTGTPPFTSLVNRGLEGAAGLGLGYATHNPFLAAAPLLMDSVPVKTATGYLLYHGGRAAGAAPNLGMPGAVAGATAPLLQGAQ
jgi:hypothetical protein